MFNRFVQALLFSLLPIAAHAACVPTNATTGMIGCEPQAASMADTDYIQAWLPGLFPNAAQIIQRQNLLTGAKFSGGVLVGTFSGNPIFSGNVSVGGTLGVAGATTLSGGVSISGGGFTPGSISTNSSWGAYIEGLSGSVADVALATHGGLNALKVLGSSPNSGTTNGAVEVDYGLMLGNARSITWSGTSINPPNSLFLSNGSWSGTLPNGQSSLGGVPLNLFEATDNLVVGTSGVGNVNTLEVYTSLGAATTGARVGLFGIMNIPVLTGDKAAGAMGQNWLASSWITLASANEGGTALTQTGAFGAIWGADYVVRLGASATYFQGITGIEMDVGIQPSAHGVLQRFGFNTVSYADFGDGNPTLSQGTVDDTAYAVSNSYSGNKAFVTGFSCGQAASVFAIDPLGSCFAASPSEAGGQFNATNNTYGWLLDGINGTYSGGLVRGPGFRVGATGGIISGPLSISYSGGTSTIDTSQFVGPAAAATFNGGAIVSGGTGMLGGMRLTDAYGGVYICSTASGGACTLYTVYAQPIDGSSHSGTVPLTPDGQALSFGAGGTNSVTETWTAGTTLNLATASATLVRLGSAAADQVLGSGVFLPALNTTAGFAHLPFTNASSGSGGIPTGTPGNTSGPACVFNDVTFVLNCYSPSAAAWKHVSFSANAG